MTPRINIVNKVIDVNLLMVGGLDENAHRRRGRDRNRVRGTPRGRGTRGVRAEPRVAVRRDQLASACARLAVLAGKPAIVFFGNNPAGRLGITGDIPGDVYLGFP